MSMRAILYLESCARPVLYRIRQALGVELCLGPLPSVIGPLDARQIDWFRNEWPRLGALFGEETLVLAEDGLDTVGSTSEAEKALTSSSCWRQFLEETGDYGRNASLRFKEHPFFWTVLARFPGGGIPPGTGFLVDRTKGMVFERRYIDLTNNDDELL